MMAMITFREETITVKAKKVNDEAFGKIECRAQVAYADDKPTGLAYHASIDGNEEIYYSLTHVPTGCAVLGAEYDMESEKAMKRWVEFLLEFADWSGERPQITSMKHALKHAAIGAYHVA